MTRPLRLTPRPGRWIAVAVWMLACVAALVAAPADARAGKMDETLDLSVSTRVSQPRGFGLGLRTSRGSAVLEGAAGDAQLVGPALSITPMVRLGLSLSGVRFGVGTGFTGYRGLALRTDRLPADYRITDGRVGGIPVEGYGGYALPASKRVRPFVEARTTATVMVAHARLSHRHDGALGELRMHRAHFEVGGRAGVLLVPNDYVFIEASVGRVFYGGRAWTGTVAIGLPIPLDNL